MKPSSPLPFIPPAVVYRAASPVPHWIHRGIITGEIILRIPKRKALDYILIKQQESKFELTWKEAGETLARGLPTAMGHLWENFDLPNMESRDSCGSPISNTN